MARRRTTRNRTFKTLVPIFALALFALVGATTWLVYSAIHPPARPYIVTPARLQQLGESGLHVTEEQWSNADGSVGRGWLLRGEQSAPAVIFLHPYGGNRSFFLNLGIKLGEATNYTVLWTDARGHGAGDAIGASSFGVRETADVADAISFLRSLKAHDSEPLVGGSIGLYGVEMGAYSALLAAPRNPMLRALALDSVPDSSGELLRSAIAARTGIGNPLLYMLAETGARIYFTGNFPGTNACAAAAELNGQNVLLLAGADAANLQTSTQRLQSCFSQPNRIEAHTDLPLTGTRISSATALEAESYDRRVIEFFSRTLRDAL
jgi:pimeloyl-ACP methyl ester carboxylesterase